MSLPPFYPQDFDHRIGFKEVVDLIVEHTSNKIGKDLVSSLRASTEYSVIKHRFDRIREMISILQQEGDFPSLAVSDQRYTLKTLTTEGTHILEDDLPSLLRALEAYLAILSFLLKRESHASDAPLKYPALSRIPAGHEGLGAIASAIRTLLNPYGKIKDEVTPELYDIRRQQIQLVQQISRKIRVFMDTARQSGFVDEDAQPSIRDGRPVIPLIASFKKDFPGIVHDESSTGKTLFVEPLEVVNLNNRKRELEAEEKRELIRILLALTDKIRPHIPNLEKMYLALGRLDAIHAIAQFAIKERASIPKLKPYPCISWSRAVHPLLRRTLARDKKEVVPFNIELQAPNRRILMISGPNAGGKSVCLKTVGLLQYMLQAGIPIPVAPDSIGGVFSRIALDIGDDQSIENDLSTYSSHLKHMRFISACADKNSLILIDEFGGGTEPEIGGVIAEGLLDLFNRMGVWGVITTHYRNLKEYASQQKGIVNGAMLYDPKEMRPLFELSVGHPGSSFAIEIARKQGLPKEVIEYATRKMGKAVLDTDSMVQEIAKDKQYWEQKKREITLRERTLEQTVEVYKLKLEKIQKERDEIIRSSQKEAQNILQESRARIENTIRKIVESQANKEKTKEARKDLENYAEKVQDRVENTQNDLIEREIERLKRREERKKNKQNTPKSASVASENQPKPIKKNIEVGDHVEIISQGAKGKVVALHGQDIEVVLGNHLRIHCKKNQLRHVGDMSKTEQKEPIPMSNVVDQMHNRRLHFSQEIDVRGMRLMEAVQAVEYYVDEAIGLNVKQVRILHGTGTGALREGIRNSLKTMPGVQKCYDEDVRFGGAGITIVLLG